MKWLAMALLVACAPALASDEPWTARDLNPVTQHAATGAAVRLVENRAPVACVFAPGRSAPGVDRALTELQTCLKLATGAELPVVEKLDDTRPTLVIGDCDAGKAVGLSAKQCHAEGFAIKTAPRRVFIVGDTNTNGLAWGVYEFAERIVGARWYFPTDAGRFVPNAASLVVPATWIEDHPVFPMRQIWPATSEPWHGQGTDLQPVQTALRSANTWPHQLQVHTPNWSGVEPNKRDRPEVFQLTEAGKRDYDMLCYGNPRTLQTYLEEIEKARNHDPAAHVSINGDTITVSPNDAELACYCADCRRLWNPAGGATGTASKVVGSFTSRLATEVHKRWPEMTVLQLAYLNYTDAPDGVSFGPNVEVQVCGMPGMAMYKEPAAYAHEVANLAKWMKLTGKKVQNWHYSCWPADRTHAVYAYPHVVQKYYRENQDKLVGSFINGETDHWPRQHLSLYCWLKVLWNPQFDVDAAIDGYCRNACGPAAADALRELVKLQIDGWENSRWPGGNLTAQAVYGISYPPPVVERMRALVTEIRDKARGDALLAARAAYITGPFDAMFAEAADGVNGRRTPVAAPKAAADPVIDGKMDDAAWANAPEAPFVGAYDREKRPVKYPTTVRAVWTGGGVTFGFRMTEPAAGRLQRSRTGRDNSTLWWDDNVELILDVTGKGAGDYYHFIVTPADVVADARGKDYSWNCPGLKVAAAVASGEWTLEVFVPISAFPEAVRPAAGTRWLGNFTRHRLADSGEKDKQPGSEPEYQRLNTTYAIPSENLSDLGPIEFRN